MSSLGNNFYDNLDNMIESYQTIEDIEEKEEKLKAINEFIEPAFTAMINSGNDITQMRQNTEPLAARISRLHENFFSATTEKTAEMRSYLREHGRRDLFYTSYSQVVDACDRDLAILQRKLNLLITIKNDQGYNFLVRVQTLPKELAEKGLAILSEDEPFRQSFLQTIQGTNPEQLKDVINVYSSLIGRSYNKSVFFTVMDLIPPDKRVKFFETGDLFVYNSSQRYKLEKRAVIHSSYIEVLMDKVDSPGNLKSGGDYQKLYLEALRLFSDYPKAAVNYIRLENDYNDAWQKAKGMIEGRDDMTKNGDFINQLFVFAAHFSYWISPNQQMDAIFKNPEQYSDGIISDTLSFLADLGESNIDLGESNINDKQIKELTIPLIKLIRERKTEDFEEILDASRILIAKLGSPNFNFSETFIDFLKRAIAIPADLRSDVLKLYKEAEEPYGMGMSTQILTGTTPEQREKILKMAKDIKTKSPKLLFVLMIIREFPEFENKIAEIASIRPNAPTKLISFFKAVPTEKRLATLDKMAAIQREYQNEGRDLNVLMQVMPYLPPDTYDTILDFFITTPPLLITKFSVGLDLILDTYPDLVDKMHAHLTAKLNSFEDMEEVNKLARTIWRNQEAFRIYPEHELEQLAVNCITMTETDVDNPKNPYNIYKIHLDRLKAPMPPVNIPLEDLQEKRVALNLSVFQERAQKNRISYGQLPQVNRQLFDTLFQALEARIKALDVQDQPNPLKTAIEASITSTFETFTSKLFFKDQKIDQLLKSANRKPEEQAPQVLSNLLPVMAYLANLSNERTETQLLSSQEEYLIRSCESIQNCSVGKEEGIALAYNYLIPNNFKYEQQLKVDIPAQERALNYLDGPIQSVLNEVISSDQFLKAMIGLSENETVKEAVHQIRYIKNAIGRYLGLKHILEFDPYSFILYDALVEKGVVDLLSTALKRLPPRVFTKAIEAQFKADNKVYLAEVERVQVENERIRAENERVRAAGGDESLLKAEIKPALPNVYEILKGIFDEKITVDALWDMNEETYEIEALNDAGAREIFLKAGLFHELFEEGDEVTHLQYGDGIIQEVNQDSFAIHFFRDNKVHPVPVKDVNLSKRFYLGDSVVHPRFGEGVIQRIDRGLIGLTYEILFSEDNQSKVVLAKTANLTKRFGEGDVIIHPEYGEGRILSLDRGAEGLTYQILFFRDVQNTPKGEKTATRPVVAKATSLLAVNR